MVKVKLKIPVFRRMLAERNISQNRFAQLAGLTSGFMSQLLAGIRNPSPAVRKQLWNALNKSRKAQGLKGYAFDDIFRIQE